MPCCRCRNTGEEVDIKCEVKECEGRGLGVFVCEAVGEGAFVMGWRSRNVKEGDDAHYIMRIPNMPLQFPVGMCA